MITITLNFPFKLESLNSSVQIGDTAYYTNPTSQAEFNVNNSMVEIGVITGISFSDSTGSDITTITCSADDNIIPPTDGTNGNPTSYIFFSKNNKVNSSSMLGYYSEVQFKNNSKAKSELFATACEVFESSK
tara:strand:- start:35 stop:430 length:396 start_codon:yes stop_codon:yes gene_type:complete